MKINYCLPIMATDQQDVLYAIRSSEADYYYFEVWLDYLKSLDDQFLGHLKDFGPRLIIVFRRQNHESMRLAEDIRHDIIQKFSRSPVLIDFDISQQANDLGFVHDKGLAVRSIVSYHDYEHTPVIEELEKKVMHLLSHNPEIVKLSTYCQSPYDAIRLLELQQQLKAQKLKHIILGMGPYGYVTRVFGTLWGNEMIFAPSEHGASSAPNQLTREQLESIFRALDE